MVVNIAWRSQWSHDMLGVHRPTTVAALLLATERARRAIDVAWSAQRSHDSHDLLGFRRPTVVALLTTERRRARVAARSFAEVLS